METPTGRDFLKMSTRYEDGSILRFEDTSSSDEEFDEAKLQRINSQKKLQQDAGCTLSKLELDFDLEGKLCPGSTKRVKIVRDVITLTNTHKHCIHFEFSCRTSPKYGLQITPPSGKIRRGKSIDVHFLFQMFCTTKVDELIHLTIKKKEKASRFAKPTFTSFVLTIYLQIESELSTYIDYDEIEIKEEIGKGGYAKVYRGRWRGLDVAVKKLHYSEISDSEREVFDREITLLKKSACPWIVKYIGSTQVPEQPICIIMELIELGSLDKLLKQFISSKLKLKIILDIARGMSFLHENKIYHRDLKPHNVLVVSQHLGEYVNVKIADFDTGRMVSLGSNKTERKNSERTLSRNMGTLIYMAPEMLLAVERYLPDKCDVFSYGMLCLHVYTQKEPYTEPPYNTMTPEEITEFVTTGKRLAVPKDIPSVVQTLIQNCLIQIPTKRPDFKQIVNELSMLVGLSTPQSMDIRKSFQDILEDFKEIKAHTSKISRRLSDSDAQIVNPSSTPPISTEISEPRLRSSTFAIPNDNNNRTEIRNLKRSNTVAYVTGSVMDSSIGWSGDIPRDEAEQRLSNTPAGTFLTRWSK